MLSFGETKEMAKEHLKKHNTLSRLWLNHQRTGKKQQMHISVDGVWSHHVGDYNKLKMAAALSSPPPTLQCKIFRVGNETKRSGKRIVSILSGADNSHGSRMNGPFVKVIIVWRRDNSRSHRAPFQRKISVVGERCFMFGFDIFLWHLVWASERKAWAA